MDPIINRILDLAVSIQQIPAPTSKEGQRAEYMHAHFLADGLVDVSIDHVGNVFGRLPGEDTAAPVVISAHLDTVFPAETDLRVSRQPERITGPGIGDNAIAIAGLLGLVWFLRARDIHPAQDIWLVANVGEEGLGDLRGMRAIVDRFGDSPRAYLILEGMALGHIYHRALGVQRYRICAHTAGGHSWTDYGQPSAIHELATLVTKLTVLPLPNEPRTTLNVGVISGGTSVNTISSDAYLELDIRSENLEALNALVRQVGQLVSDSIREGVTLELEVIGQRPAGEIPASHPLVRLGEECLHDQGLDPILTIGSTDANLPLSRGLPAICVGLTTGGVAHTLNEFILTQPLRHGLEQMVCFISRVGTRLSSGCR